MGAAVSAAVAVGLLRRFPRGMGFLPRDDLIRLAEADEEMARVQAASEFAGLAAGVATGLATAAAVAGAVLAVSGGGLGGVLGTALFAIPLFGALFTGILGLERFRAIDRAAGRAPRVPAVYLAALAAVVLGLGALVSGVGGAASALATGAGWVAGMTVLAAARAGYARLAGGRRPAALPEGGPEE